MEWCQKSVKTFLSLKKQGRAIEIIRQSMSKLSKTKGKSNKSNELKQVHHVLRVCDFWSCHMLLLYCYLLWLLFSTSHKTQAIYLPLPRISWYLVIFRDISWYMWHLVFHISSQDATRLRREGRVSQCLSSKLHDLHSWQKRQKRCKESTPKKSTKFSTGSCLNEA